MSDQPAAEHERAQRLDLREEWRLDQLVLHGYDYALALDLACDTTVDLHRACDLLTDGCPYELARRILT